jgi:hypothetical protein
MPNKVVHNEKLRYNNEHNNVTVRRKIRCEYDLAAQFTVALLALPCWRRVGEKFSKQRFGPY